jgi:hypothetical protein
LETALSAAIGQEDITRNHRGLSLLCAGLLIAAGLILMIVRNPQVLSQTLSDLAEGMMKLINR